MFRSSIFGALALAVVLCGCATGRDQNSDVANTSASTLSASANGDAPAPEYKLEDDRKIAPLDTLELTVVGEKDLEKIPLPVNAAGEISGVPYIKEPIKVAGKTVFEVRRELETLWTKDIFVKPEILLIVKTFRQRFISVDGKVNHPTTIELPPEQKIDILAAIARAQGFAPTANQNKIILNRPGKPNKVYRYKDLIKNSDPAKRIYLEPEDTIFVQDSLM